ncbi:MAG: ABC transporter ATP-binding protein [Chloroflexi bacterium]|nr:ABC transporter ATP-binding protein [Chloroflexota bacterium]
MSNELLLEVKNLHTSFHTEDGVVPAVSGVDFAVRKGQTLGLVGESGCGKSVTALSIMRLVPPPGRIVDGEVRLNSQNLLALDEKSMRALRGKSIAMIFQEPMTSLNPVYNIGSQIVEALLVHNRMTAQEAREKTLDLLRTVGIPTPEERFSAYPHELSGGMRQRVMIAMALSCGPALLIADEPTTALDVTIQAQILELIGELKKQTSMALLLITHDLGVIAEMADEVAVMYAGEIVEQTEVTTLFAEPAHPYTRGLLTSIPSLESSKKQPLSVIKGSVPSLLSLPQGCRFAPRCPYVMDICWQTHPLLERLPQQWVRCWLY